MKKKLTKVINLHNLFTNIFIFEKGEKANMKIKNLLIVPLLGAALVATSACSPSAGGSTSASESSTSGQQQKVVTRVSVKAVQQVVQGDELDFDTLVTVYYDDDSTSKDYTLEVAAASSELVTVSGKKATFVKEGTVNITVKAGAQSAKFSTEVISKVKKEANEYFSAITNNYVSAITEDAENFDIRKVHRPNYTYSLSYPNDTTSPFAKGHGYLKFANEHAYEYSVTDSKLTLGEKISGYENYFVNMDLSARILEGVTLTDDEGVDYVRIDSGLASEWAEYGFYSQPHYFIYNTTGLDITLPYDSGEPEVGTEYTRWEALNIYKIEDAQEGQPGFEILATSAKYVVAEYEKGTGYAGENDTMKEGTEEFEMSIQIAALKEEDKAVPFIEEFIADPDNEPISKDYTAVATAAKEKIDGEDHNYTLAAQSYFFRGSPTSPTFDNSYLETISVTQNAVEFVAKGGAVGDYGKYWGADVDSLEGFAVNNGQLYTYERTGTDPDFTYPAKAAEGRTSIFNDAQVKAVTPAVLGDQTLFAEGSFFVSAVSADATTHEVTYVLQAADSLAFIKAALNATTAGKYYISNLDYYFEGDYDHILSSSNTQTAITLMYDETDTNVVGFEFDYFGIIANFNGLGYVYFQTSMVFSGFGSATVDTSKITWPN